MTVAIGPESLDRFMELSRRHEVESTVIGKYEKTGKLRLTYGGKTCAYLDLSFFSRGFSAVGIRCRMDSARGARPRRTGAGGTRRFRNACCTSLLASPNLCSREWIQRQYDHEVQGGSAVKFMTGRDRDIPNDAAVIRPVLGQERRTRRRPGAVPTYSEIDTYHMVAATIDEAVRRIIAVGGRLDEIGGVDNFCWPNIQFDPVQNPDGKYKAAQLVRANRALRDIMPRLRHSAPFRQRQHVRRRPPRRDNSVSGTR